jgi:tetratricopeptide (TPR) repeat protein
MLLFMGKKQEALDAYRRVAKAKMERHVERQVLGETQELIMKLAEETTDVAQRKAYAKEIEKINNVILWYQDLWFGKAIVIMAHLKLLEDDFEGATKLISEYGDQLLEIDKSLRQQEAEGGGEGLSRLSPMAQCRYMLGLMRHQKAEKLLAENGDRNAVLDLLIGDRIPNEEKKRRPNGALHEFTRVFLKYPNTAWAPDAGKRSRKIVETLEREFRLKVTTSATDEEMAKVRQLQYQNARTLLFQQQYEGAVDVYLEVLNLFPDTEETAMGLEDLAKCYVELQDETMAQVTIHFLAERFSGSKDLMIKAGNGLLRLAGAYDERKMNDRRDATYRTFFRFFRDHPQTPALMFRFGDERLVAKNYAGALDYFTQLATNYPGSATVEEALNRTSLCYVGMEDFTNAVVVLEQKYLPLLEKKDRPGQEYISGRYRLATVYRRLGDMRRAHLHFHEVVKTLNEKPERYRAGPDDEKKNRELLEAAAYYKADILSKMPPSERADEKQIKLLAIKSFGEFVQQFPKAALAPRALSQIGTLYTLVDQPEDAEKAFRRLQAEYAESPEAKNSRFMLAMTLLELNHRKRAIEVFKDMFADKGGTYTPPQILTAGDELLKAGEWEIAGEAFQSLLAKGVARQYEEPALLGKGKALVGQAKWDEAAKTLSEMMRKNPRSAYTVEACIAAAKAYGEVAKTQANEAERITQFNNAIDMMNKAKKFEKTKEVLSRMDLGVARIYVQKAEAETKFGKPEKALEYKGQAIAAYLGLTLFGDTADAAVRPHVETAFGEVIPLLVETRKWQETIDDSIRYDELFGAGKYAQAIKQQRDAARIKLMTEGGGRTEEPRKPGAGGVRVPPPAPAPPAAPTDSAAAAPPPSPTK